MTDEIDETLLLDTSLSGPVRFGPNSVLRQRYQLHSQLGQGGMGVVYRATDLELERQVAVKLLPERVSSPDARERFLREARAAAALNHPNIVVIHDVGEDQGVLFLVMELVDGKPLLQSDAARRGAAPRPPDLRRARRRAPREHRSSGLEAGQHSRDVVRRQAAGFRSPQPSPLGRCCTRW